MKKLLLTGAALLPASALAHVGDHSLLNLSAGFLHPLSGADHLLALLATGIWLGQSDTRPKPAFIAAFCAVLALTIVVGMQFTQLTFEAGIVATLVVLGALLAAAVRGPLALRAGIVIATAAVHGFVHGTELPAGEGVTPFIAGLIASSFTVVSIAMILGTKANSVAQGMFARVAGALLVLTGFIMAF
ncbi:MAG: HupE/UreJ family protein [Cellvibrionaceae bacterium]|nr:HupE/UreJ family protein [Cellvibrionaceae bacterium]